MIPFYNTSKWVLIALSQRFLKSAWQCTRALYIHCCGTMRYPSDRYFIDFPSKADGNVGAPTRNNGANMCSLLGMLTKGHPQKLQCQTLVVKIVVKGQQNMLEKS